MRTREESEESAASVFTGTTSSVEVRVTPEFLEDQSRPGEGVYVWSYEVEIENKGHHTMHLLSRYWKILNSSGQAMEVRGEGVVGDQPHIQPGTTYSYSSFTNLTTPSGLMYGTYEMEREDGERVEVSIPPFSLDSPDQRALPN